MNCKKCNDQILIDSKFCPECLKRYMPEPIKIKMKFAAESNFPDRYICPECNYEELA